MLSRRQFLTRTGAAGAVVLSPQALLPELASARKAPRLRSGTFAEGVASGDPAPHAITLWTRIADLERNGSVCLEVARDKAFRRLVASETIGTGPARGGSVKARVNGLAAYEQYFFRFETATTHSEVGRFRTAPPADSRQPLTFAFFSCQDFTHGYYNAHDVMADEDLDFVVCLGDYIYAETYHTLAGGTAVREDAIGSPGYDDVPLMATTLEHYREKYALYRGDKSLRRVHAKAPMIVVPDDHEVQDNYAGAAPGGGLPAEQRYSRARERAGRRAWLEAMPTYTGRRNATYRRLRFGRTMDLIMLDQRSFRDDQPCGDATVPPCPELPQPRDLLGTKQMAWAKRRLDSSKAAWKVIGNEVMMMPAKVTGGAYAEYDSWQGYPTEREELLGHIKRKRIKDVVFITGDIHTFIAGDVRTENGEGETVALEFVGGSVTSENFGETDLPIGGGEILLGNDADPKTDQGIIDALRAINTWVDQADFDHHGFGLVNVSPREFDVRFKRVSTIKSRTRATEPDAPFRYAVERGQKSVKRVNGPAV